MVEYKAKPLSGDISVRFVVTVDEVVGWSSTELAERTFTMSGDWALFRQPDLGSDLGGALQRMLVSALEAAATAQVEAEQEPDDAPPA